MDPIIIFPPPPCNKGSKDQPPGCVPEVGYMQLGNTHNHRVVFASVGVRAHSMATQPPTQHMAFAVNPLAAVLACVAVGRYIRRMF